jgi:hypothetical protein
MYIEIDKLRQVFLGTYGVCTNLDARSRASYQKAFTALVKKYGWDQGMFQDLTYKGVY